MKSINLLLGAAVLALSTLASAAPVTWCDYHDYFHAAVKGEAGDVYIAKLSKSGAMSVDKKDSISFYTRDTKACAPGGGYASVTYTVIGSHGASYCDLTIHDAEDMMAPNVQAVCHGGLQYTGWTYGGFMSYSYPLNFRYNA